MIERNKKHFIGKHYLLPTYRLLETVKWPRELICRVPRIWGSKCLSDHQQELNKNKLVHIMCKLTNMQVGIAGYVDTIPNSFLWHHGQLSSML